LTVTQKKKASKMPVSENKSKTAPKILVMDDDAMIRKITSILLSRLGYKPDYAKNGQEAIRLYDKALKEKKPFALAIIDLAIPGGMGGWEAFQKLKKIDPSIYAIVSSGDCDDPIVTNYEKYGFKGCIIKPYAGQELTRVINDVLKKKSNLKK
jgi:DNA-binding NtrC family response regulator